MRYGAADVSLDRCAAIDVARDAVQWAIRIVDL
jgi:hypothetical protein